MAAPASSGTLLRPRSSSSLSSDATSHAPDPSENPGGDDIDDDTAIPTVDDLSWNCLQTTRRFLESEFAGSPLAAEEGKTNAFAAAFRQVGEASGPAPKLPKKNLSFSAGCRLAARANKRRASVM
ncbi:hypothetical protein MRX96_029999 [Rhipicephalus microplus]